MLSLPIWTVHYTRRRPALGRPLTSADYLEVDVGSADRDGAAAAFCQRYPAQCQIQSIVLTSALGAS